MPKNNSRLIMHDGWNVSAFHSILRDIGELERIKYEINNCKRTMAPSQMVELLENITDSMKEKIEML